MSEPGALAAAIVTSGGKVLIGRSADRNPPWVFPAGPIESGESPEDAAVRETRRTAGLGVRSGGIVGSWIDPRDGYLVIYVAAIPAGEADAAADGADLAEVRWVTLAEAAELMTHMSTPVRRYLQRTLDGDW
jgi:8-oxo-dGTP diphosphatase